MSSTIAPPTAPAPGRPARPRRDAVIDAVRTGSMFVVVALHALLVGAWRTGDGGLATRVALTEFPWFPALTWLVQVMPLFFIAGGFAGITQWRRMRERGATATGFVLGRVRRLAVPAAVMITVVGLGLAVLRMFGGDSAWAGLLDQAAYRIGQPLWFLAVYAGATALVPIMVGLHERFRWAVPAALLAAALAVDLVHGATDLQVIGYVNLAFVWLFNQQLGFCLADAGTGARGNRVTSAAPQATWAGNRTRPRRSARPGTACSVAGLVAALAAIAFLGARGWPLDLLAGLNPPTAVLALVGVAQLCALLLAYPWLHALVTRPAVARIVKRAGSCAITVYLWHMPVVLLLVALLWAAGAPLPTVHSPAWWATRWLWLAGVAACVVPVGLALSPVERWTPRSPTGRPPRPRRRFLAASPGARVIHRIFRAAATSPIAAPVLTIAGVATALLGGLSTTAGTLVAACLLWGAVLLSTRDSTAVPAVPEVRYTSLRE